MYRDEILDHYKRPRNEGRIEDAKEAEGDNPSCGDHVHVYVETEDGKVEEVRHETDGCAISTAAASVLSEELVGMAVEEVLELDGDWIIDLLGIDVSPMRRKCAVLCLTSVQEALAEE